MTTTTTKMMRKTRTGREVEGSNTAGLGRGVNWLVLLTAMMNSPMVAYEAPYAMQSNRRKQTTWTPRELCVQYRSDGVGRVVESCGWKKG